MDYRTRRLIEEGKSPSPSERLIPALRAYFYGGGHSNGLFDTISAATIGGAGFVADYDVARFVSEEILARTGIELADALEQPTGWGFRSISDLDTVLDLMEAMWKWFGNNGLRRDFPEIRVAFTEEVNRLLARENYPFHLRDGRVERILDVAEVVILDGLPPMASGTDRQATIENAIRLFVSRDPADRQVAVEQMALAWDAAKSAIDPKSPKGTLDAARDRSLSAPNHKAQPNLRDAWDSLFKGLNDLTQKTARHSREEERGVLSDDGQRFLFMSLASAIRLIWEVKRARDQDVGG